MALRLGRKVTSCSAESITIASRIGVRDKPRVGVAEPGLEIPRRPPPHRGERRRIQAFERHAVRPARVESQVTLEADDLANLFRQLPDRRRHAGADVDRLRRVVAAHQKQAGVGEIVDVDELTCRRAGPPDVETWRAGDLRLVHPTHQRRNDV